VHPVGHRLEPDRDAFCCRRGRNFIGRFLSRCAVRRRFATWPMFLGLAIFESDDEVKEPVRTQSVIRPRVADWNASTGVTRRGTRNPGVTPGFETKPSVLSLRFSKERFSGPWIKKIVKKFVYYYRHVIVTQSTHAYHRILFVYFYPRPF